MSPSATAPRIARPRRTAPRRAGGAIPSGEKLAVEMLEGVRASGLKLTPQRIAIVREIACDPTHPTAQELYERLLPSMPTMSFATVYNTLDALTHAGLCSARALAPGPARFDPNMAPHDHAVCERCGLVRDVRAADVRPADVRPADVRHVDVRHGDVRYGEVAGHAAGPAGSGSKGARAHVPSAPVEAIPGFSVRSIEQIYRGLCEACASRGTRSSRPPRLGPPRPSSSRKKAPA